MTRRWKSSSSIGSRNLRRTDGPEKQSLKSSTDFAGTSEFHLVLYGRHLAFLLPTLAPRLDLKRRDGSFGRDLDRSGRTLEPDRTRSGRNRIPRPRTHRHASSVDLR